MVYALRHAQARYDSLLPEDFDTGPSEAAHDAAVESFWNALEDGRNARLPLNTQIPAFQTVAQLLTNCSDESAKLLFAACHAATKQHHPQLIAEQNAKVAYALRQFIEAVCDEYADDNAGAYE